MAIKEGDTLPEATLLRLGDEGPEGVPVSGIVKGRKVVIFAVPGAFTPTCHAAHVPSFIRTKAEFDAKGVDEIVCLAVNDPFIMKTWGEATGATEAGISMLSDGNAEFTKAIGMDFDGSGIGLGTRSKRYAMVVNDGVVEVLHTEDSPGVAEVSTAEAILKEI